MDQPPEGQKHAWTSVVLTQPTWCSVCSEFLWLTQDFRRCSACGLVVHTTCMEKVALCSVASAASTHNSGMLYRFTNLGRIAESISSTMAPEGEVVTPETGPFYRAHYNTVVGGIRSTEQDHASKFPVYTIYLLYVEEIMGNKGCTWNRKYEAAQQIFGSGPGPMTVRAGIMAMQAQLYRRGSSLRTKKGYLTNGDAFLSLLKNGRRANNDTFFTYVLRNGKLNFSETGAEFFRDFTSKHAVHSKCSENVRYAGEFHFSQMDNGKYMLWIDNNSGTYAPNKDFLPLVQLVFEKNFPGLVVGVMDHSDPVLQQRRNKVLNLTPPEDKSPSSASPRASPCGASPRGNTPSDTPQPPRPAPVAPSLTNSGFTERPLPPQDPVIEGTPKRPPTSTPVGFLQHKDTNS